jgi:TPR repeat protein
MKDHFLPAVLLSLAFLFNGSPCAHGAVQLIEEVEFERIKKESGAENWSPELREGFRHLEGKDFEQALAAFTKAARNEEITAFLMLGIMYREGYGIPRNPGLAKENFSRAAAMGSSQAREEAVLLRFASPSNPEEFAIAREQMRQFADKGMEIAQLKLGQAYLTGYGFPADSEKAIAYMTRAANSDNPFKADAALALGRLYRDGNPKPEVKADAGLARKWLKVAADTKRPEAMLAYGEFLLASESGRPDYPEARSVFLELDDSGDPFGAYQLGQMSEHGWGVEKELEAALRHYRKAAGKKLPEALYRLGAYYDESLGGLGKDEAKALDYYRQGAELGHPTCMFNLSVMLETKQGTASPGAEAITWLLSAAGAGMAEAEYQAGVRYQAGRGVLQDFVAAAAWFDRAARSGHALAQLHLGEMYETGQGLVSDLSAARRLFELSANGGNTGGMVKFAVFLANGTAGDRDLPQAYAFAESAAAAAPENGMVKKVLEDLKKSMTAEQLAEGRKRLEAMRGAAEKE